jgi:hypothetical protein
MASVIAIEKAPPFAPEATAEKPTELSEEEENVSTSMPIAVMYALMVIPAAGNIFTVVRVAERDAVLANARIKKDIVYIIL